jgi:hypothetical protein
MIYLRGFPIQYWRFVLPFFLMAIIACQGDKTVDIRSYYSRLDKISQKKWDALSKKRVFFGHKSVGQNIIEGIQDVVQTNPQVKLDIRDTINPRDFDKPIFAHSLIGTNKNPSSKIRAFREILESGVGRVADIAFFKFCFVDIDHSSDLGAIFKEYEETVTYLENKFPNLRIITFTVPLISRPVDMVSKIKRLLGRMPWEEDDNVQRNMFNEMIRSRIGKSLFDLAAAEATSRNGDKVTFSKNGKTYDLLNKAYTYDGGHLNSLGRQIVAIDLLLYLVSLEPN